MNIVIAGAGKFGETLACLLSGERHSLTIIDQRAEALAACTEAYDVMAVGGNCASADVLEQADIQSADLLIAVTGADEMNLLCCTTAKHMNPKLHTIARIRNPEYNRQKFFMRDVFGLSLAVNPERRAALEIERLLKFPGFLKRDTFAKGRVEIVEISVGEGSRLCDTPLHRLVDIVKCRVLVCAVLRDGAAITPHGSFVLKEGDRLFVTASTSTLSTLLKNLGVISHRPRQVMLLGGDRVGYYLADMLVKDNIAVKIVDCDLARCEELAAAFPNATVVHGEARNQAFLESEGLGRYDAVVSLTGLDELNIVLSLHAASRGVPYTVTKIGHTDSAQFLQSLPLGSVVCPKDLSCNTIVRYVRAMQNQTGAALSVHTIADGLVEAMEFLADDTTLHCGVPLKDLPLRRGVLIVGISHGGKTEIPNGNSCFQKGNAVVVVSSDKSRVIYQLNDIFE